MQEIVLQHSSGRIQVDTAIQEVVGAYEDAFPAQIAGYYVEGSYADQSQVPTSDIDITIVFRGHFADENTARTAEQIWETSAHKTTMEMDITVVDEESLQKGVFPTLKLGSRLVYGYDICGNYPILPLEAWTRERMHSAYWLLTTVYQRPSPVHMPIGYPDPTDEFFGYTNRTVRLPDGKDVPCTRNLVRTTGWAATALLALRAGQYAARKRDSTRLYRHFIGDEWSSLLEEIATFCRDEWQYLIPAEQSARQHLRSLCERTRGFEQHFLTRYKPFLLEQLRSGEQEHVRFARWVQEQLPLDDEEVRAALQVLR